LKDNFSILQATKARVWFGV